MVSVSVYYNENWACRMRGLESDKPSITEMFTAEDELSAILKLFEVVFGWDENDVLEYFEGEYPSARDALQFAEDRDITGGDPILFSFDIGSRHYETSWDPIDFELEDE